MKVDIEQTSELLRSRAFAFFEQPREAQPLVSSKLFSEKSTYPLYQFTLVFPDSTENVIVKFAPVFPENNEGLTEFLNMKRMWESASNNDDRLGLVRPLDFFAETNALVSEYVVSERLTPWMMKSCCNNAPPEQFTLLEERIEIAGRWLRLLHDTTRTQLSGKLSESNFLANFEKLASHLGALNILSESTVKLRNAFTEFLQNHGTTPVPVALIHGDFGPQNMNFTDKKVYVFDLQRNYNEVIYHDMAYFLVTLNTLNPYPKYFRFNRARCRSLKQPFLAGYYSREPDATEELLLNLYLLSNLYQRAFKQFVNLSKGRLGVTLAKRVINFRYEGLIDRELEAFLKKAEVSY